MATTGAPPAWRNRIVRSGDAALSEITPNPANWRQHPKLQADALGAVLADVGVVQQVIINQRSGRLVDGHLRVALAEQHGEASVPALWVDLDDDEERLILATLDPLGALAETNRDALSSLLGDLAERGDALGEMLAGLVQVSLPSPTGEPTPSLSDRFLVPPFSVLDARQGYWQERKRAWLALGIESELGRGDIPPVDGLLGESEQARTHYAEPGGSRRDAASLGPDGHTVRGDGRGRPASGLARSNGQDLMRGEHVVGDYRALPSHGPTVTQNADGTLAYRPPQGRARETRAVTTQEWVVEHGLSGAAGNQSGTSIFDPVLCELAYSWFCPPGGAVLDPFAGGSVRGIVASRLGRAYTGVDLSAAQLAANEAQAERIVPDSRPRWIEGDSADVIALAPGAYDLLFSCPPYADLERYSDDPRDISTMDYPAFLAAYRAIVAASVAMLSPDRFACFVVGDVRDPRGLYRGLVPDTIAAFADAGAALYNEAILVTAVGSLPIRVGKQFVSGRKLGKTHQNVLVFVKGDPKRAADACGVVEVYDPGEAFGEPA